MELVQDLFQVHLKVSESRPIVSLYHTATYMLDKQSVIVDMNVKPTPCTQGHIAQWLEHPVYNREVLGSNPSLVIFLCGPTLYPLGCFPFGPCFPIGPFPHWVVEVPQIQHAYLNGTLEEEIYMLQPEGFEVGGQDHVCRLRKSLYSLKQEGRVWNKKLHSVISSMGFKCVQSDHGLYIYLRDDVRILMPVFVDDITLACKDGTKIDSIVQELPNHFKLRSRLYNSASRPRNS